MRGVWRGICEIEGSDTCMKIGGAVSIGAGASSGCALTVDAHDIGGAMNCTNPGRPANSANQRSRFGNFGLVMPSTPNQRRA